MADLTPRTRSESFLNGEDLEPITRDEMLWSGEDVEPITRREMYIRHLYDETQVIPDKPITREEMFILKAGEELHDVTIEQLNVTENGTYSEAGKAYSPVIVEVPETTLTTLDVTENGTYTAPSGTAYNEVEVDVPLPENAYLLKDIPATPASIATFTDGSALPMPKLEVAIEPVQEGSGDPSPENIRPISGWSAVNVYDTGVNVWDEEWEVGGFYSGGQPSGTTTQIRSKNYIPVFSNVTYYYKGSCQYMFAYDASKNLIGALAFTNNTFTTSSNAKYIRFCTGIDYGNTYNNDISINYPSTDTEYHAYNGHTYTIPFTDEQGNPIEVFGGECDVVNGGGSAYKEYDSYNGETLIGPWISDRDVYVPNTSPTIGAQVVDMGDTSTFTSQPTSPKSIVGENNVWGDCGNISEGSYFSKGEEE